jgi:uncharacterized Zn finger protein (UPF0148 family)
MGYSLQFQREVNDMDRKSVNGNGKVTGGPSLGRCPACNMTRLEKDGDGAYCPNCLYTPAPPITLEDAVAKAEAVAVAESRALRDELARENRNGQAHRRRAA